MTNLSYRSDEGIFIKNPVEILRGTDYTRYMTQDSVNEKFTITHTISPYFENLGSSKLLSKFSGFKLYYILAEGENLDGQISITGNNSRYNPSDPHRSSPDPSGWAAWLPSP